MSKLKGFILCCVLALIGGTANADIIIDNQSIPSTDISSISISPASGHLYVSTIPGYTVTPVVTGSNVAITNFTVSPATILAGQSTTVSWSTVNAVSCTATNGTGGWSGTSITPLASGSKSITATTAGTYQFTLTCNGSTAGDTKTSNVTLTVSAPNAVSIGSFTASPTTLTEGGSTTLSWSVQNATVCTPTNGTGGWNTTTIGLPTGSKQISMATAGTYTFTLTCQDASAGTAVKSVVVIVEPAVQQCATPTLSGTVTSWKTFWLVDWPKPTYDNRYVTIPRTGFIALEFNTGNISTSGKLYTIETTVTDGVRLGAISQCPGDFNVEPECDYTWGISGGLSWATNGTSGCQLAPNTTYYFNVTYTNGVNPETTTCSSSPCITTLQNVNR